MAFQKKKYTESDEYLAWEQALKSHGAAPTYDSGEVGAMATEALKEYLNRPKFSYDVNADALYNQMADKHTQMGKMAMWDTIGKAATMTGGYGNSYATMAGQQAYQGYMQDLTDKIPELQQLAYDQYMDRGNELLNKYGLLSDEEQKAYGRWRDKYADWANDREYLTGRVDQQAAWDREDYWNDVNFDYGMYRDTVGDNQWQQDFDYRRERDKVSDDRYAEQTAYERQWNEDQRNYERSQKPSDNTSSKMTLSDALKIYDATGDASFLAEMGIDTSNAPKNKTTLSYTDFNELVGTVGDKVQYDENGNISDTSAAESYLDWLVANGTSAEDAAAIAKQNGFEYSYSGDTVGGGGKQLAPAQYISYFKGILDTEGVEAVNEEIDYQVAQGNLTAEMGAKYKKIFAGKSGK